MASFKVAATTAQRLNKAVRAGRVPALVVDLLNKLEDSGLSQHFTVAACTRSAPTKPRRAFASSLALATHDVDLLWDARQRVRFLANIKRLDKSMLQLQQEVDFLRRMQEGDDPHPFKMSSGRSWPKGPRS